MCRRVSFEKSATCKTSLTVGCLPSWMTLFTLCTFPSFLTWKCATWTFKILNQICSLLKYFCPAFALYLWWHNKSFLKHLISARICFLMVTTKLGANYPFLSLGYNNRRSHSAQSHLNIKCTNCLLWDHVFSNMVTNILENPTSLIFREEWWWRMWFLIIFCNHLQNYMLS